MPPTIAIFLNPCFYRSVNPKCATSTKWDSPGAEGAINPLHSSARRWIGPPDVSSRPYLHRIREYARYHHHLGPAAYIYEEIIRMAWIQTHLRSCFGAFLHEFEHLLRSFFHCSNHDFSAINPGENINTSCRDKPLDYTNERFMRSKVLHLFVPGISRSRPALIA